MPPSSLFRLFFRWCYFSELRWNEFDMHFEISGEVSERGEGTKDSNREDTKRDQRGEGGGHRSVPLAWKEKEKKAARFDPRSNERMFFFSRRVGVQSRDLSGFPTPLPRQDANLGSMPPRSVRGKGRQRKDSERRESRKKGKKGKNFSMHRRRSRQMTKPAIVDNFAKRHPRGPSP